MNQSRCSGCGVLLPDVDGPTHRYMESSPACWAMYGEVLSLEYSSPAHMSAHRLTVDAYAAQHPGRPCAQSIQSVAIHLVSLHLVLELGRTHAQATAALGTLAESGGFVWLAPPAELGAITVADVAGAATVDEHARRVRDWARSVWGAWSPHHAQVRAWAAVLPRSAGARGP